MKEIANLRNAYALFSAMTHMPYVECEAESYDDEALLFESKAAAEAAVTRYKEKNIFLLVQELNSVELPAKAKKGQKLYFSKLRQHLSTLPYIGVNAIRYEKADGSVHHVPLGELLPEDFEKKVSQNPLYQPNLQLTGLYLMQEARRKRELVDAGHLKELDEEFSSNLVKGKLFIALMPPEGAKKEEKPDLKSCKLPYLKHQNGTNYFPLFTDIWEFQKYAKGKEGLRSIQVPFMDIMKFQVKEADTYMINPMGFSLPLKRELVPKLLTRFS